MPEFLEVFHARVEPALEDQMVRRRPELLAAIREALPGLRQARLVKLDDGTWLDMLSWESREAADAATARLGEIPAAGELHGYVEEVLAHHRGEAAE